MVSESRCSFRSAFYSSQVLQADPEVPEWSPRVPKWRHQAIQVATSRAPSPKNDSREELKKRGQRQRAWPMRYMFECSTATYKYDKARETEASILCVPNPISTKITSLRLLTVTSLLSVVVAPFLTPGCLWAAWIFGLGGFGCYLLV